MKPANTSNAAKTLKTLTILGATALTLSAGASHADFGRPGYPPAAHNPWLAGPAYQQARYYADLKVQLDRFDERQERQLQRILTGMEQGKLTMTEAIGLLREHTAISALERQYMADGRLGSRELRELEERLDQASAHIRFEKHDFEQRGKRPGPDRHADNERRYR